MNTRIKSVDKMRYPTAGDYFFKDGVIEVEVFDQKNEDHNFLIAIHELVEEYLTRKRGISETLITAFDIEFEKRRLREFDPEDVSEPGDDPAAPYYREHRFAMIMEQMMAHELGVDWNDYDKNIKVSNDFNIE